MHVCELPDDALRCVLRCLSPVDLLRSAAVCRRWSALAASNEMWAPQLQAMQRQKVNLRAVLMRGSTACRDYWCMQHWLRQSLAVRGCRVRTPSWQAQLGIALRGAERGEARCRQNVGPAAAEAWQRSSGSAVGQLAGS